VPCRHQGSARTKTRHKGASISDEAALVFAGGDAPPDAVTRVLPGEAFVIAADSGLAHALALDRRPDLVVGDLDSVDVALLADAKAGGAEVEAHPADKDETDLELALDAAMARGYGRITIVGAHGGRVDHYLANLTLLASPRFAGATLDAWVGPAHVVVVRGAATLTGPPGSLVTLVALGGPARGIRTEGLRYPLADEDLDPGTSRGVSNELEAGRATVRVREGVLLAILPHALAGP
jgi:thiamine pyrophosphokinase